MLSILRVELFRLKKSTLFWVMLGICFGLPMLGLLLVLFMALSAKRNPDIDYISIVRGLGSTTGSLDELVSLASVSTILGIICAAIFLSKEFSDGTVRNVLLANKKRTELYFSYTIISVLIGVSFLTATFLSTLLFEATVYGFEESMTAGQAASACLCSYAMGILASLFCQTCVAMFLFAVRKQSATLAYPLLICIFAPALIELFFMLYMISKAMSDQMIDYDLIKSWLPLINSGLYNSAKIDGGLVGKIAMYYLAFTGMFVGVGYAAFRKADLK